MLRVVLTVLVLAVMLHGLTGCRQGDATFLGKPLWAPPPADDGGTGGNGGGSM